MDDGSLKQRIKHAIADDAMRWGVFGHELDVTAEIMASLQPLSPEQRRRVLEALQEAMQNGELFE